MPNPDQLAGIKEQVERKLEEFQLKKQLRLLENLTAFGDGWGSFVDPYERFRELSTPDVPIISTTQDRRYGRDWPFFQNETELALTRMPSRLLCSTNSYAIGLMNGLTSFTLNTGFTYRMVKKKYLPFLSGKDMPSDQEISKWIVQAQGIIDEFHDINAWESLEPELFWRTREDGEYYLRHFLTKDAVTKVRTVEPEQNRMPMGKQLENWSFGIENPVDAVSGDVDAETALNYCFIQLANPEREEIVPAEEIVHCKVNTKRSIKRGLTDFYGGTLATLEVAERLRRAVSEGAVEQASIIEIIKIVGHNQSTVAGFVDQVNSRSSSPQDPRLRNRNAKRKVIPEGQEYTPPPSANNVEPHLAALQACLRAACVRWNAPEFLGSADASNNALASAETASTHFVTTVERARQTYKASFKQSAMIALRNAVTAGRLDERALACIDLEVDAPPVVPDDKGEKANADGTYITNKVKSPQTTAVELGLDPETELNNFEDLEERFGPQGPPLPMPGAGGGAGGGNGSGDPKGGEPAATPFPEVVEPVSGPPPVALPDIRQQSDYDCGTACLRSVAMNADPGLQLPSQWTLAGLLGTDPKDGTRPTELIKGAEKLGLECRVVFPGVDGLIKFVQAGFPVICAVQADDGDPVGLNNGHYVVVTAYDPDKDSFAIHDPAKGACELSAFAFGERWHDVDADGHAWDKWGVAVRKAG